MKMKYVFGIALRQTSSLKPGTESSNLRLASLYLFATCQRIIRNILELSQKFKVIRGSGYVFSYYEWYLLYFRKIEELSLLTTEPVMERNNSREESMVAEDGYDDHSEGLTETIKTDIPPLYSKILMETPVTSYQHIFLI